MMKNGGPAFPIIGGTAEYHYGMTLRDAFSIAALQGIVASLADESDRSMIVKNAQKRGVTAKQLVAAAAYEYADAMLAEREKP